MTTADWYPEGANSLPLTDRLANALYPDDPGLRERVYGCIMGLVTSTDVELVRIAGLRMLEMLTDCPWSIPAELVALIPELIYDAPSPRAVIKGCDGRGSGPWTHECYLCIQSFHCNREEYGEEAYTQAWERAKAAERAEPVNAGSES